MIEQGIKDVISAMSAWLQGVVPNWLTWLVNPARRVLEYLGGPVLDHPGRFPWWGMVAAFCIAAIAYGYHRRRYGQPATGLLSFCFPCAIYRHPSAWVDVKVGFFNYVVLGGGAINLTWRISTAFVASYITTFLAVEFGPPAHVAAWSVPAIVLLMLAISMATDFGYFLFHWASHSFAPLWAIHKLHHSAEVMTPLTAARVHPLEKVIMGPFIALTTGLLIGPIIYLYAGPTGTLPILGLDIFGSLFFLLGHPLHHSHIWVYFGPIIGRVIVSPAQHQIHHSSLPRHLDKNFAEHWALWDTIFGTLYLPEGKEELKLGLAGYNTQPHPGLVTAWLVPVADSLRAMWSSGRKLCGQVYARGIHRRPQTTQVAQRTDRLVT